MKKKYLDLNTNRGRKLQESVEDHFQSSGMETIELIGQMTKATHIVDLYGCMWTYDEVHRDYLPF